MIINEEQEEEAPAEAALTTMTRRGSNDWLQNISKFISTIEDDGMLGLAQSIIAQSTDMVVSVASSAIETAVHVVSDVSSGVVAARFVNVPQHYNCSDERDNNSISWNEREENGDDDDEHDDDEIAVRRTKSCSEHKVVYHDPTITTSHHHSHENHHRDNSPFGILSIASTIVDIMLGTISPLLVRQREYHYYNHHCNNISVRDCIFRTKCEGTTSSSTEPIFFLHAERNSSIECADFGLFFDTNESCTSHAESVYYDATSSTRSLSTTDSFVSSDDAYEENDGEENNDVGHYNILELQSLDPDPNIPRHVVMLAQNQFSSNTAPAITKQTFYLDMTDVLSKKEQEILISTYQECIVCKKNSIFYIVRDSVEYRESFHRVLDSLVKRSFCIAQIMDDEFPSPSRTKEVVGNHGDICWKPDDRTKKYLDRRHQNSITTEDWTHILETDVLKWTGSDQNSNSPMLKTRGIIDMSPLELKELLLDCERNHLYNQNSISKTNIHCFADIVEIGGETKIVQNVMKIPIVGGAIQIVSLTHVRCIEDGGYILVSQSVGDDANTSPANPYFSISILRSVPNSEQKTELTNITMVSSMPIPKFLMQKVAIMGATDFFNNLRSLCK